MPSFTLQEFFSISGVIFIAILTWKLVSTFVTFIFKYFLSGVFGLSADVRHFGDWAVITGSTDGIGKAYAEQLAKRGCNLVLISRSEAKLTVLANDMANTYNIETRTVVANFARGDIYDNIASELIGLDIGILVNNVGASYDYPEYFLDIPNRNQKIRDMMHINMMSMSMMTSIVLPGMVKKHLGAIVSIGSVITRSPCTLLALSAANKKYVDYLSRGLQAEYESKGVIFQTLHPAYVATNMSQMQPSLLVPSATTYVKCALSTLGVESVGTGYWRHTLLKLVIDNLPAKISDGYFERIFLGSRRQALERKATKVE